MRRLSWGGSNSDYAMYGWLRWEKVPKPTSHARVLAIVRRRAWVARWRAFQCRMLGHKQHVWNKGLPYESTEECTRCGKAGKSCP